MGRGHSALTDPSPGGEKDKPSPRPTLFAPRSSLQSSFFRKRSLLQSNGPNELTPGMRIGKTGKSPKNMSFVYNSLDKSESFVLVRCEVHLGGVV